MAEVKITVERFDRLKEFPAIAGRRFGDAMDVATASVIDRALPNSPVDRGFYRSAFNYDTVVQASPFQVQGSVLNSAPYASIIEGMDEQGNQTEFGRRPGAKFPNLTDLRAWVVRVIGPEIRVSVSKAVSAVRALGQKVSGKKHKDTFESEIDDATFAIGRSIARKGIKAKAPLQNALKASQGFIQRLFDEASSKAAKDLEGGV